MARIGAVITGVVMALGGPVVAGGSLSTSEITPILERDKTLGPWLLQTFVFCEVAGGMRFGRHWEHLSGGRVGPYHVLVADRRNPTATYDLTVYTEVTYYNKQQVVWTQTGDFHDYPDQVFESTHFTEKLTSAKVNPTTKTLCNGSEFNDPEVMPPRMGIVEE